jgi:hypothetical protein
MSRSTFILPAISMTVLLAAVGTARADVVYEWTDAKGEVHYTDQWVPGAKLVTTDSARRAASGASAAQGIQSAAAAADGAIKQQQAAQAVQADEAKVRAERCTKDKAVYQQLLESRRIYTTDKNGERQYLSDADADAARLRARQAMDADCGSGS